MTNIGKIEELVKEELREANEKHPLFSSAHEAYAVIKEEVEEVEDELEKIETDIEIIWQSIKTNERDFREHRIKAIKANAENLAAKAIQVAAMCQKMIDSEV